jgi:tetratricopeptide (TPR) repeat protein
VPRTPKQAGNVTVPTSAGRATASSPARKWAFRICALLLPFFLLAAIEIGLRRSGYYWPSGFWLKGENPGELITNTRFADRFVGPVLARMPRSARVQERPPAKTLRVVVFGESAALGDPEPAFGMSRCLEALLEHRFPDKKVEVINTAVTALNSYAIREAARSSRRLHADFWVIYAGNNEVVGPFGPASVVSGSPPGLLTARLGLKLRATALGQWLTHWQGSTTDGLSLTQRWTGLELFVDRRIAMEDPRLATMRGNFKSNLGDAVRFGVNSGAKILLGTMAVNLVDCAPFASPSRLATNDAKFALWAPAAAAAQAEDEQGAVAEAVAAWRKAAALWPEDAETRYRLGMARLNAGDSGEGRADLEMARDLDMVRLRADSGLNQVTREVAQLYPANSMRLVDAARDLRGTDPDRPPGMDTFLEHVHLRPEGNYRLARIFAEAISGWVGAPGDSTNWLDVQACLQRLGWSPFAEARLWRQARAIVERPPFTLQSNAELRNRFLDDRIAEANRLTGPTNLARSIAMIRSTADQHLDDWHLREQLARLLHTGRRWVDASVEWRRIVEMAPGHVVGWYQLGEALSASGDKAGAEQALEKALALRPDFVDAQVSLGSVLAEMKKFPAALQALDRALAYAPDNLQARVNRGVVLIALERNREAVADLKRAAAEHPTAVVPLLRLGEWHASRKEYGAAADAYTEAARRETNNPALRHRLATELSRAGRTNEAELEFSRLIEQVPDSPVVRMDYGVALARQERFAQARLQFEEALKLQPTNAQIQAYLRQVEAKLGEN